MRNISQLSLSQKDFVNELCHATAETFGIDFYLLFDKDRKYPLPDCRKVIVKIALDNYPEISINAFAKYLRYSACQAVYHTQRAFAKHYETEEAFREKYHKVLNRINANRQ